MSDVDHVTPLNSVGPSEDSTTHAGPHGDEATLEECRAHIGAPLRWRLQERLQSRPSSALLLLVLFPAAEDSRRKTHRHWFAFDPVDAKGLVRQPR